MKVSALFTSILIACSAIIPRVTNDDGTVTISSQYQLKENVNFIKVTGSTNIKKLKSDYPNGEIVNDLNNPYKKIFILDLANLLDGLTKKDVTVEV